MRRIVFTVALVVALPGAALAGGGGQMSQCSGFAQGTTIGMLDSCFEGIAHFAPAGTRITVRNDGQLPHTFTAVDGSFDSGQLQSGETFDLTIDQPGVFQVFCTLHGTAQGEGMAGVLLVGEALPPAVASGDLDAIEAAISADREAVLEALDRQYLAISSLSAAQANLRRGLENAAEVEVTGSETGGELAAPAVIAIATGEGSGGFWVPVLAGLGAGLGAAALLVALGRRRETPIVEPLTEERSAERVLTRV